MKKTECHQKKLLLRVWKSINAMTNSSSYSEGTEEYLDLGKISWSHWIVTVILTNVVTLNWIQTDQQYITFLKENIKIVIIIWIDIFN